MPKPHIKRQNQVKKLSGLSLTVGAFHRLQPQGLKNQLRILRSPSLNFTQKGSIHEADWVLYLRGDLKVDRLRPLTFLVVLRFK
jgi:hypothetical protein